MRIEPGEGIRRRRQHPARADGEGHDLGLGPGHRVGPDHLLRRHRQVVGDDVLHALVQSARGRGPFEDAGEHRVEGLEQGVLVLYPQRQEPVEPGVHRRQVVGLLQLAIAVQELKPGLLLESHPVHRRYVPPMQGDVERLQRAVRPRAFEIVLGPEEAVAGRSALALGQGAQTVQPPRDRRGEPLLAVDVGRDRTEQRRAGLVGPMRPAKALDRRIGPPAGLAEIVPATVLVPAVKVGVVAAPRAAGVGEHQHPLLAAHEGVGLGLGAGRAATLHHSAAIAQDDPARAAGDLGDVVRAERAQDRIQHTRNGGQAGQMDDQGLPQAQGFLADDRLTIHDQRAHRHIAFLIRGRLHGGDREGPHQIVEHLVLGGQVDGQVVPLFGRDLGQPALHHRLIGRDDLHDAGASLDEVVADRRDQGRRLQARQQRAEEAQLGALESRHDRRSGLTALGLPVLGDADRLQGGAQVLVDQLVGVGPGVPDLDVVAGQHMAQRLIFHPVERQRPGDVEAERLQFAGDQLHDRHAALLDGVHEGVAGVERRLRPAPQAQTGGIGQVLGRGRTRGADIHHPCIGQPVLQGQARHPLLGGLLGSTTTLAAARRVGHGVGFVKGDHPVEVGAQPADDLVEA